MKLYIPIVMFFSSCVMEPVGDQRLLIVNNTTSNISFHYDSDTIPEFPSANHTDIYLRDLLEIGDSIHLGTYNRKPWPEVIEASKNGKLNLFIYKIDSLKKYGIDTIIKRKIYTRLEYSKEELEKQRWIVIVTSH